MRMFTAACMTLFVSGCAMFNKEPSFPWSSGNLPCSKGNEIGVCDEKEALKAYTLARAYCHELSSNYEDGGDFVSSSTFAIAGVGTLAGAVFSPLAEGGAKTAWSGLSGSANALQTALNTNFSNAVNARRRAEIANSGAAARDQIAREEDKPMKQVLAAIDMAYDCKMAIGRADVAVVQALNEIQAGAGKAKENSSATVKPTETKEAAEEKAAKVSKPAAVSAANVTIAPTASSNEKAEIKLLRVKVAEAAADTAATVAASTAVETAQKAAAAEGETPSLIQTQIAAKVAAESAAEPAARAAAEAKAVEVTQGKSKEVQKAVMDSVAPASAAAAQSAADAAAGEAAAPAQPFSSSH